MKAYAVLAVAAAAACTLFAGEAHAQATGQSHLAEPGVEEVGDRSVPEGDTSSFGVTATRGREGSLLELQLDPQAPPFVRLDGGDDGLGTLVISPGFEDAGEYDVTITAAERHNGVWITRSHTFALDVPNTNRAPAAADDTAPPVPSGYVYTVAISVLLANDSDPDGPAPAFQSASGADVSGDEILYGGSLAPGTHSFTYAVADEEGLTDEATVSFEVLPNAPPAAGGDSVSVDASSLSGAEVGADPARADLEALLAAAGGLAGGPFVTSDLYAAIPVRTLVANDADPEGGELSVSVSASSGAHVTGGDAPYVLYRMPEVPGSGGFSYTVEDPGGAAAEASVSVEYVNSRPHAGDDVLPDAPHRYTKTVQASLLLGNDGDPDPGEPHIRSVEECAGPSGRDSECASLSEDRTAVEYGPLSELGEYAFTYVVSDGGGLTAEATATFTVVENEPPLARGDTVSVGPEDVVREAVLGDDLHHVDLPRLLEAAGERAGAPFVTSDWHVIIPARTLTANDADPEGGDLFLSEIEGAHLLGHHTHAAYLLTLPDGSGTFTYTATDPGGKASTAATVSVGYSGALPVARNDELPDVPARYPVHVPASLLFGNDTNPAGGEPELLSVGWPARLSADKQDADHTAPDRTGLVTFPYTALYGPGLRASASVSYTVGDNLHPTAAADRIRVGAADVVPEAVLGDDLHHVDLPRLLEAAGERAGAPFVTSDWHVIIPARTLTANDADPEGGDLFLSGAGSAHLLGHHTHAAYRLPGAPGAPDAPVAGSFTYTIADPGGLAAEATAHVRYDSLPEAAADSVELHFTNLTMPAADLLANDSDPDRPGSALSVARVGGDGDYEPVLSGDGSAVTLRPRAGTPDLAPGDSRTYEFHYYAGDSDGDEARAEVDVKIHTTGPPTRAEISGREVTIRVDRGPFADVRAHGITIGGTAVGDSYVSTASGPSGLSAVFAARNYSGPLGFTVSADGADGRTYSYAAAQLDAAPDVPEPPSQPGLKSVTIHERFIRDAYGTASFPEHGLTVESPSANSATLAFDSPVSNLVVAREGVQRSFHYEYVSANISGHDSAGGLLAEVDGIHLFGTDMVEALGLAELSEVRISAESHTPRSHYGHTSADIFFRHATPDPAYDPVTAGLVRHWDFDPAVSHGDAAITGATYVDDPALGKVLSFDGNDRVVITDEQGIYTGRSPVSLTAWIAPTTEVTSGIMSSKPAPGINVDYRSPVVHNTLHTVTLEYPDYPGRYMYFSVVIPEEFVGSDMYQLAVVRGSDPPVAYIMLDDLLVSYYDGPPGYGGPTSSITSWSISRDIHGSGDVHLGATSAIYQYPTHPRGNYHGTMDHVRIYDKALLFEDAVAIYRHHAGPSGASEPAGPVVSGASGQRVDLSHPGVALPAGPPSVAGHPWHGAAGGFAPSAGAAFVLDPATGAVLAEVPNPRPRPADLFGSSVAAGGGLYAAGAPGYDGEGAAESGIVYVFDGEGRILQAVPNPDPDGMDRFGDRIEIRNGRLVVDCEACGEAYEFSLPDPAGAPGGAPRDPPANAETPEAETPEAILHSGFDAGLAPWTEYTEGWATGGGGSYFDDYAVSVDAAGGDASVLVSGDGSLVSRGIQALVDVSGAGEGARLEMDLRSAPPGGATARIAVVADNGYSTLFSASEELQAGGPWSSVSYDVGAALSGRDSVYVRVYLDDLSEERGYGMRVDNVRLYPN